MISFSGPTAEVEYIARQIAQLGRQDFARDLMGEFAQAAQEEVQQEFVQSRDPDGNAWAPLKRPRPGGPVLDKTGKLKRIRRYVSFAGFTLKATVPYAGFHQNGTRRMVARKFFPVDGQLPRAWALRFERISDATIAKLLSGTRRAA